MDPFYRIEQLSKQEADKLESERLEKIISKYPGANFIFNTVYQNKSVSTKYLKKLLVDNKILTKSTFYNHLLKLRLNKLVDWTYGMVHESILGRKFIETRSKERNNIVESMKKYLEILIEICEQSITGDGVDIELEEKENGLRVIIMDGERIAYVPGVNHDLDKKVGREIKNKWQRITENYKKRKLINSL